MSQSGHYALVIFPLLGGSAAVDCCGKSRKVCCISDSAGCLPCQGGHSAQLAGRAGACTDIAAHSVSVSIFKFETQILGIIPFRHGQVQHDRGLSERGVAIQAYGILSGNRSY